MKNLSQKIILIVLTAVPSAFSYAKINLTLSEPGQIKNLKTNQVVDVEKGQAWPLESRDPVAIYSEQGIPVILVPNVADGSNINVDLPARASYQNLAVDLNVDAALSDLLEKYSQLQTLIMQKKIAEARNVLADMRSKYKRVTFLNFVEASLDLIDGEKAAAITNLKKGLKVHPEYKKGADLLIQLEEKK